MDFIKLAKKQWDRSAGIVLSVIGVIALIKGWMGVRGTPVLAEQTRYIVSGGIGAIVLLGLAVVGAGNTLGFGRWWTQTSLVRRFPWLA